MGTILGRKEILPNRMHTLLHRYILLLRYTLPLRYTCLLRPYQIQMQVIAFYRGKKGVRGGGIFFFFINKISVCGILGNIMWLVSLHQ
jgi:hypothetical protein